MTDSEYHFYRCIPYLDSNDSPLQNGWKFPLNNEGEYEDQEPLTMNAMLVVFKKEGVAELKMGDKLLPVADFADYLTNRYIENEKKFGGKIDNERGYEFNGTILKGANLKEWVYNTESDTLTVKLVDAGYIFQGCKLERVSES